LEAVRGETPGSSGGNAKLIVGGLGIALSVGLLWYILRNLDWGLFLEEIKKADPKHLVLLFFVFYLTFFLRAYRWKFLLPSDKEYSIRKLFDATMVGFFASIVLPLRAGEIVRPWALNRWQGVPGLTAFASIVVERVFDVLALMIILGLCMSSIPANQDLQLVILGAKALSVIALVIGMVMTVAYLRPTLILSVLEFILAKTLRLKWPELCDKIVLITDDFIKGFRSISSFKELGLVIFWSGLLWVAVAFFYQVGLWVIGESPEMLVGFTVSAFIALAVAAPSAPGFVGTFQYGCVFALHNVFGYTTEKALAFSIIVHCFQMALIIIHGLYILNREGLKLSELRNSSSSSPS
jgi:uncharacterized protein (TIRG00374 family)